jgi:hypothetical protein
LAFLAFLSVSCGSDETLRVRQFHLQDTSPAQGHPFIRAEMNERLYGAVTLEERNLRRGNYYHLRWQGLSGRSAVKVVFEYRQARTGVKVNERVVKAAPSHEGELEISVHGRDYLKDGHVQSWRFRLYDGEKMVASKQSYLWQ